MATEEVNKPASLPPYPELIFGAIDELKEKEGSNKSSIMRYIESKHGDLPAGFANSVTETLNKMKEDGDLVLSKNNYMRPDPTAPPKRGRGRPPKAKDPSAAAAAAAAAPEAPEGPTRGRGRPRKDPNAPPAPKKAKTEKPADPTPSKSGRPRGRPRKVEQQQPPVAQNSVAAN